MKLMQGGDTRGAFAQLMGAGDTQGAAAIARLEPKQMNPLQEAQTGYWNAKTAALGAPKQPQAPTPPKPTVQQSNYCFANPNDPRCLRLYGGQADPTGQTPHPTAGGLDAPVPASAVGDTQDPFMAFMPGAKKPLTSRG